MCHAPRPYAQERASTGRPYGRALSLNMLGGSVPPPVFEVSCTDRAFVPATARIRPGQSVRYRTKGSLNHIIAVGDHSSPLLRPGTSWILNAQNLDPGTHEVHCEVTCMRGAVLVEPPAARKVGAEEPATGGADAALVDASVNEADDFNDPRIDGLVAQLRAGPLWHAQDDDEADEQEDEKEFLSMRQRNKAAAGATLLS